jgi:hypothetical protein
MAGTVTVAVADPARSLPRLRLDVCVGLIEWMTSQAMGGVLVLVPRQLPVTTADVLRLWHVFEVAWGGAVADAAEMVELMADRSDAPLVHESVDVPGALTFSGLPVSAG